MVNGLIVRPSLSTVVLKGRGTSRNPVTKAQRRVSVPLPGYRSSGFVDVNRYMADGLIIRPSLSTVVLKGRGTSRNPVIKGQRRVSARSPKCISSDSVQSAEAEWQHVYDHYLAMLSQVRANKELRLEPDRMTQLCSELLEINGALSEMAQPGGLLYREDANCSKMIFALRKGFAEAYKHFNSRRIDDFFELLMHDHDGKKM